MRDDAPPSGWHAATRGRAILRHGPRFSREAALWRWWDWQNHFSGIARRVGRGFLDEVVSGSGSAFSVMDIWGMRDDAPPSGRPQRLVGGPSSGMAQDSAAKRRHGDGGIGKIIFRGSCGELVAGVLSGVVSGSGSAFSVMDIWGMRDDAPPSGRRAATHGRAILRHGPNFSREAASWRWRDWRNYFLATAR
jgi:hypothetical protein